MILPILATVAILGPLVYLWQASWLPNRYSVMTMGYLDYGGGPVPGAHGSGTMSHGSMDGPVRSIADLVVDPHRKADVRVDLVARAENFVVAEPSGLGLHHERHAPQDRRSPPTRASSSRCT